MKKKALVIMFTLMLAFVMLAGCGQGGSGDATTEDQTGTDAATETETVTIGMCPKFTSDNYMLSARDGAQAACDELGYKLDFNGPVDGDVSAQADIISQWVQKGYTAITVSANDKDALSPAMQAAKDAGVFTSAWDADVQPQTRDFFMNQFTAEGIAKVITECMVKDAGTDEGNFLILTSTLTAPNQTKWIEELRKYIAANHPKMIIDDVLPGDEDVVKSRDTTMNYLRSHPDTKGVIVLTTNEVPGAVEAVKQLGMEGKVMVGGIMNIPSLIREYFKEGTVAKSGAANSPYDLGYAAMYMIKVQVEGNVEKAKQDGYIEAGRLGKLQIIDKDNGIVLIGDPVVFDASNIDNFTW
ncbi:MAG TPA: substrate-binding domain-containing protein [Anaerovoracaceae bacterium]|nr:substrate-binding domain-containing protein [Anaerovoracaceae bacterium]